MFEIIYDKQISFPLLLISPCSEYLRILEYSDSYNLKVFRILSLSVANKTHKSLLPILEKKLSRIASYKYIPLLPQLVPHIGNQNVVFEKIINDLLGMCYRECLFK